MKIDDIYEAEEYLKPFIRKTHLIKTEIENDYNLYLKPENLQITGSFKIRGAFNKLRKFSEEEKKAGAIACSAGNHAQGIALASKLLGIKATVCMPKSAQKVKIESCKKLGAEVVLVDGVYDDAYEKALELHEEYGYTFVHPFNDEDVIAGQATIGLEILNELKDIDAIVCPIGGGGLIAGIAFAAKSIKPSIKVYGVEATGAPSMFASLASGYIKKLQKVKTFADGIAVKEVGNIAFDYTSKFVDDVVFVNDEEILEAIKVLMNKEKLIAEGAGACSLAAILTNRIPGIKNKENVVCIISGGNIDIPLLSKIVMEGIKNK